MSAPIYGQVPIRLALSTVSTPISPVDQNTSEQPLFYRSNAMAIQVAVFDAFGVVVDLTNLTRLILTLQRDQDSIVPIGTIEVESADITDTIDVSAWNQQTDQQATFILPAAFTDQGLDGLTDRDFWWTFQGLTEDGDYITYGAGFVTIRLASSTIPPAGTIPGVGMPVVNNSSGVSTVTPIAQITSPEITISGTDDGRTIVLGTIGIATGAMAFCTFNLPTAVEGITVSVKSGSASGPVVQVFVTPGSPVIPTLSLWCKFNGTQWIAFYYQGPS